MPYTINTTVLPTFQPTPIIPGNFFSKPYQKILNSIDGIITKTERKLLSAFERYCFKDGLIFPKQKTLAFQLGISTRQVKRLIKSLQDKKFIRVEASSLVDRHLYGTGNRYTLLNHPAYNKISSEMSPQTEVDTTYNNEYIKTKNGFNIFEWVGRNKTKHEQAIIDALDALTARWPSIKLPGQYAQKIVDVQSGNYNAADHTAQVEQKKSEINAGYEKLAERLDFNLSGGRSYQNSETPNEITERMNRQRNELLDVFGSEKNPKGVTERERSENGSSSLYACYGTWIRFLSIKKKSISIYLGYNRIS